MILLFRKRRKTAEQTERHGDIQVSRYIQTVTRSGQQWQCNGQDFKIKKYQDVPCGFVRGVLAEAGQFLVSIRAAVEQGQILFSLLLTGG